MPITYKEAVDVHDGSWHFPSLSRDLAVIGAGIVVASAFVGAVIGVAVDVAIHRHRSA